MSKPATAHLLPIRPARRLLLLGAAASLAGIAFPRPATSADPHTDLERVAQRPLEIGLLPYMPTAKLMTGHQGMRSYFEETFKRPVAMSTAPDFHSFQRRVLDGVFDFIIIGPGPGWQAHLDRKHEVVAVSDRKVRIFIMVAKNGPIKKIEDLRGKSIVTIDPLTVTSQTTKLLLHEHKLVPGIDVEVRHDKTPFNCVQAVVLGEVAGAGFPNVSLPNLPPEIKDKLQIIEESDDIPGILFMVRPATGIPSVAEFQRVLLDFAKTEAGRAYLKEFNHDALAKPDMKALRSLERFVPETRRLLGER